VQRACAELESAQPDVQLLSALLQTRNRVARQEMYARELATAQPRLQMLFSQTVRETILELEKAVMKREPVDLELLQQLRVISVEMLEYMQLP